MAQSVKCPLKVVYGTDSPPSSLAEMEVRGGDVCDSVV